MSGPGPRRLVSLVPSVTEALFALGLGERVVGVPDWCVPPAGPAAAPPKVRGTHDTDVAALPRADPGPPGVELADPGGVQGEQACERSGTATGEAHPRGLGGGDALGDPR